MKNKSRIWEDPIFIIPIAFLVLLVGPVWAVRDNAKARAFLLPQESPKPQGAQVIPEAIDCKEVFKQHRMLRLKRASDGKIMLVDPCWVIESIEDEK